MKLDAQAVAKIATLARLKLQPEEAESLGTQLSNILNYVEELKELDTSAVQPTSHVESQGTPLRPDEPRPCLSIEDILRNAPDAKGSAFRVPRIIE